MQGDERPRLTYRQGVGLVDGKGAKIDPSTVPRRYYQRVRDDVRVGIDMGILPPGEVVRELAREGIDVEVFPGSAQVQPDSEDQATYRDTPEFGGPDE